MNLKSLLSAAALAALLVSCEKTNVPGSVSEKDGLLSAIAENFLENTVYPTYKSLADCTELLHDQLEAIKSQDDLDKAA
ncbi:MAG: peptidase M75, partial [Candidatus Cryptobacteroides sp.]